MRWTLAILFFLLGCEVNDFENPNSSSSAADATSSEDSGVAPDAGASLGASERVRVHVTRVVDGDTFYFEAPEGVYPPDGQAFSDRIRFIGVNAPEVAHSDSETDDCYGQAAKAYVRQAVQGKDVTLTFDPTHCSLDKPTECRGNYGRVLAYITLDDGSVLNEALIEHGYVRVYRYKYYHRDTAKYRRLEDTAKAAKVGLWGSCE